MKPGDVDSYIASFPNEVQVRLKDLRRTIRAGAQGHVRLYPPVRGNAALQKTVAKYAGPKGNLRFPYDEPLPLALIARIVRRRQDRTPAMRARKKRSSREKVQWDSQGSLCC